MAVSKDYSNFLSGQNAEKVGRQTSFVYLYVGSILTVVTCAMLTLLTTWRAEEELFFYLFFFFFRLTTEVDFVSDKWTLVYFDQTLRIILFGSNLVVK